MVILFFHLSESHQFNPIKCLINLLFKINIYIVKTNEFQQEFLGKSKDFNPKIKHCMEQIFSVLIFLLRSFRNFHTNAWNLNASSFSYKNYASRNVLITIPQNSNSFKIVSELCH